MRPLPKKPLVPWANELMFRPAQIARACGRVSVGWRSGQEAGEPSCKAGSRSEPVNPAKRGTRLKATTDRAFSSLSASNADLPKRLVYLAGRADRGAHPDPIDGSVGLIAGSTPRGVLWTTAQHLIRRRPLREKSRSGSRMALSRRRRVSNARGQRTMSFTPLLKFVCPASKGRHEGMPR